MTEPEKPEPLPSLHTDAATIFERAVRDFLRDQCGALLEAKAENLAANAAAFIKASGDMASLEKEFNEVLREAIERLAKERAAQIVGSLKFKADVFLTKSE